MLLTPVLLFLLLNLLVDVRGLVALLRIVQTRGLAFPGGRTLHGHSLIDVGGIIEVLVGKRLVARVVGVIAVLL